LRIVSLNERLEIDVVTSDPAAVFYADRAARHPGVIARERAEQKIAKHAKAVNDAGADFTPVSIEVYGLQDKKVKEVLAPMLGSFMNRQEVNEVEMPQRVECILNRLYCLWQRTQRGLARSLRRFAHLCRNATPANALLSRANADGYTPADCSRQDRWMDVL
jgi:hypothetical protein